MEKRERATRLDIVYQVPAPADKLLEGDLYKTIFRFIRHVYYESGIRFIYLN